MKKNIPEYDAEVLEKVIENSTLPDKPAWEPPEEEEEDCIEVDGEEICGEKARKIKEVLEDE